MVTFYDFWTLFGRCFTIFPKTACAGICMAKISYRMVLALHPEEVQFARHFVRFYLVLNLLITSGLLCCFLYSVLAVSGHLLTYVHLC